MVNVLDIAVQIPGACFADEPARWVPGIIAAYNDEREKGKESPFYRNERDRKELGHRLRVFFAFRAFPHDVGRADHFVNLFKIWEASHYEIEHGETQYIDEKEKLIVIALIDEEKYPDIKDIFSVETAVKNYGW